MSYPEIGELVDDVFSVVPPRHHGVVKERHHRQILHTYKKFMWEEKDDLFVDEIQDHSSSRL
jgi:hypothetical protein